MDKPRSLQVEPEVPPEDSEAWLTEWENEQKLSPEEGRAMLQNTFRERLEYWRAQGPGCRPWVVPFHYTHVDATSRGPVGALWIPDNGAQEAVEKAGTRIHMSLLID